MPKDPYIVTPMYNLIDNSNNYVQTSGSIVNAGTVGVEIVAPVKDLGNFQRSLELPLINCEITLDLTLSTNCVICKDNAKLLQQLKSGFKRTINWNKYQSWMAKERQNR